MDKNKSVFQQVLSHFTHEFANGDIIRKYAEKGFSIREIQEHLDFPTPSNQVHEIAWNHLLSINQILLSEPGSSQSNRYKYIKEISSYGKVSFRKVRIEDENDTSGSWTVLKFSTQELESSLIDSDAVLFAQIPFGLQRFREPEQYQKLLATLSERDADFIDSFFLERREVYYRLNLRMTRILIQLSKNDLYHGNLYKKTT